MITTTITEIGSGGGVRYCIDHEIGAKSSCYNESVRNEKHMLSVLPVECEDA
uniref:Uncharacterized protein n=1 Tax=Arundo donax TaxID=35708 RepID=A0A0A9EBL2_ARUDO